MTNYLDDISVETSEIDSFWRIADIFYTSAEMFKGSTLDGLAKCNTEAGLREEDYKNNFVPIVYLYRHAIELIMKAILKEMDCFVPIKYDLVLLWKGDDKNGGCRAVIEKHFTSVNIDKIKASLEWLEQKGVLNDQLYRYPSSRNGKELKDQGPIDTECIETMVKLYGEIRDVISSIIRVKYPKND